MWFIRFVYQPDTATLLLGNRKGMIYEWNLNKALSGEKVEEFSLSEFGLPMIMAESVQKHPMSVATVRQIALTRDGKTAIAVNDQGRIFRWNKSEAS